MEGRRRTLRPLVRCQLGSVPFATLHGNSSVRQNTPFKPTDAAPTVGCTRTPVFGVVEREPPDVRSRTIPVATPTPAVAKPTVEMVAHVFAVPMSDCALSGQTLFASQVLDNEDDLFATTDAE